MVGITNRSKQKGFTLIEVVLVLAIGGLIFLLAFLAFQQVSRNRRNTERRSSLSLVAAEVNNHYTDSTSYPLNFTTSFTSGETGSGDNVSMAGFVNDYLKGSEFKGPRGTSYLWVGHNIVSDFTAVLPYVNAGFEVMGYAVGYRCSGSSVVSDTTTTGSIVVLVGLEGSIACRDVK